MKILEVLTIEIHNWQKVFIIIYYFGESAAETPKKVYYKLCRSFLGYLAFLFMDNLKKIRIENKFKAFWDYLQNLRTFEREFHKLFL